MSVRAKKHLGQHFLKDENIAYKIANAIQTQTLDTVLEVGPGMGVLTKYLLEDAKPPILLAEIDTESIEYLLKEYPQLSPRTFVGDFLKYEICPSEQTVIIGNFPYNISSQILFRILDQVDRIPEMVGMFQKEVAERIAAIPRTKDYGILSVMVQAYYTTEYLFTVNENVFSPPPKVKSGVVRLTRNPMQGLQGVENLFKTIVKTGFGQRRKKLGNALKSLGIPDHLAQDPRMSQRAEELDVKEFITLTNDWTR